MNIQPFKPESVIVPPKTATRSAKPAKETAAAVEAPQISKQEKLLAALQNEPDVRPGEVARGQELAADPNYPSDDLLAKLAEVFVKDATRSK